MRWVRCFAQSRQTNPGVKDTARARRTTRTEEDRGRGGEEAEDDSSSTLEIEWNRLCEGKGTHGSPLFLPPVGGLYVPLLSSVYNPLPQIKVVKKKCVWVLPAMKNIDTNIMMTLVLVLPPMQYLCILIHQTYRMVHIRLLHLDKRAVYGFSTKIQIYAFG